MLPIFMYHRIADLSPADDPRSLAVGPAMFEQQMAALYERGYQCIRLEDAARRWQHGERQPAMSVVLTFDDGYRDLLTDVVPVLERYGFTATVFLVADYIGQTNAWEQTGPNDIPLLTWDEIRDLDGRCFDFGSHTVTHPRLHDLDKDGIRHEVGHSKFMLEQGLGKPVTLFAYPYGNLDNRARRIVSKSGYLAACGVDRGTWGLHNMWRLECGGADTPRSILWKARGYPYLYYRFREQTAVGRGLRRTWQSFKSQLGR